MGFDLIETLSLLLDLTSSVIPALRVESGGVADELRCLFLKGQEEKTICKVLRNESFLFQVKSENNYVFLARSGTCTWRGWL